MSFLIKKLYFCPTERNEMHSALGFLWIENPLVIYDQDLDNSCLHHIASKFQKAHLKMDQNCSTLLSALGFTKTPIYFRENTFICKSIILRKQKQF